MIAVIMGAINGGADALEAALRHTEHEGVHTVLQTGNIAVGSAEGNRVAALLRDHGVACVQGELDRQVLRYARKRGAWSARLDPETTQGFELVLDTLGGAQLEWLGALPRQLELEIDGVRLFVCHGAPGSQSEVLSPETPQARLDRHRESAPVDFLICGGAAQTFDALIGETRLVCPGPLCAGTEAEMLVVSTEPGAAAVSRVRIPL